MKLNKYSKIIFYLGTALVVLSITACAVCGILAGRAGNYYTLMSYSKDFAVLCRQYIGLTVIGCVLTETIVGKAKE